MAIENKVVITSSVVVEVDACENGNSRQMELISQKLLDVIESAFSNDDRVQPTGCLAWDWLNDADTNFGRCEDCNRLVSDYEKPNQIRGLIDARNIKGELVCDECAYFRKTPAGDCG